MFKLALNAGHYKYTPGKRCHKDIDSKETREWVLNDRICDKVQKILSEYDGIEILRIDDTTGETDVSLANRTTKANNWGADFWLGVHHNAAGKKFSGGGIVAYVYTVPGDVSLAWQKDLYNALIAETGLKGNRSTPLPKKNLHEVRETVMPAVLLELGFMDSTVDCPIILTEDYADKCAKAISKVIIEREKLTKKKAETSKLYRVQVGAFAERKNAEDLAKKLKADGYDAVLLLTELYS
jgi:N-acetylmuramoyl-L-alanine amidase